MSGRSVVKLNLKDLTCISLMFGSEQHFCWFRSLFEKKNDKKKINISSDFYFFNSNLKNKKRISSLPLGSENPQAVILFF